jgi:hypothetical protein|tara:strand:- start:64 stop:246 length:183 start_codon:yes stop_codon:yes gene_type:complete
MGRHSRAKVIRSKDCKNLSELEQNYTGLWRALGLQITKKKSTFVLRSPCRTYLVGVGDEI